MANRMASSAAINHATVLPAKLQNARASNAPATKITLRAFQYFRLIWLRNSPLRRNRAICLSSCSKRVMLVEHNPIMHELETKAIEWNVTLDEIRETPTSLIGFGVRGGIGVVLKITKLV